MKFHVSCASLSLLPFGQAFELVSGKFDGWQIVSEGRHALSAISDEFRDVSESYDLQYSVHAPMSDVNIASMNRAVRLASVTEVAECIRAGSLLGIHSFVAHAGCHSVLSSIDPERGFLLSRESIKSLSALAQSLGVELLIENATSGCIGSRAAEMKLLLSGTRAGFCLDIAHASLEGETASFQDLEEITGMVHLSDNDGKRDSHARIGTGVIDLAAVMPLIRRTDAPVVIEALTIEDAVEGRKAVEAQL